MANLSAATKSMKKLAFIAPFLSKKMLEVTWDRLLEKPEDQRSGLADLSHVPDLMNLPHAYIVVAEFDPPQDEGAYYVSRLFDHAVPVSTSPCKNCREQVVMRLD